MSEEHNPANMMENMGIISNITEELEAHITGFRLGAFMEASALRKSV
jgi:hypothetical protein